jgi:hypothetical protein
MTTKVITNKVRFSFVNLHKPKQNDRGEDKFSVTILLPKSDTATYSALRAAEQEAKEKKFPGKPAAFYTALKSTIYDGNGVRPNGESFGPECRDCWVFTASTGEKPGLVDENLQPLMEPIKSGDYGRVSLNAYAFDTAGNRGATFGLNNVQLLERGESLGGRTDAASDFAQF